MALDPSSSVIRRLQIAVALDGLTISVGPGACYLPGTFRLLSDGTASVTLSAPVANTWYHAYGYKGASGSLALEVVQTAPSAPYQGSARTKTGDATRRYLGSMYVGADQKIRPFRHINTSEMGNKILFDATSPAGSIPLPALNLFSANTSTTVQLNPIVPATATTAILQVVNMSNRAVYVSRPGLPAASNTNFQLTVQPNESVVSDVMLSNTQQFTAVLLPTSLLGVVLGLVLAGSVNIYSLGYYFDR